MRTRMSGGVGGEEPRGFPLSQSRSRERGVMSSEEADHVSPWEVTPTVGKGTLGTWRSNVSGLIKPVQSPDAVLETRLWANHGVRVYANQRLSLGEEGKAYGGKAKTSNRTGEIPPSGIIEGPRETSPWWE